ncbi:unnamed protein product [Candida parapsilosis]
MDPQGNRTPKSRICILDGEEFRAYRYPEKAYSEIDLFARSATKFLGLIKSGDKYIVGKIGVDSSTVIAQAFRKNPNALEKKLFVYFHNLQQSSSMDSTQDLINSQGLSIKASR